MHTILPLLATTDFPPIARESLDTVQVNLGYRCNQSCVHCHVAAGPHRSEEMSREVIDSVLAFLKKQQIRCLDLTGGAPELNPHFRYLVESAREAGVARIIDRCNLTILEEPGQENLAEFLAGRAVEIVASLPCYLEENVDRQRGKSVFETSIRALSRLNALGYGQEGAGLALNLVYNPQGPVLPPPQSELEATYKRELGERFGIVFNRLFTLANMPIRRFGSLLVSKGQFEPYMNLLKSAYCDAHLGNVMCRSLLSIDWQGYVYDCDFNQMLDIPLIRGRRRHLHLADLIDEDLTGNPIQIADHCFGCTAGEGSSCQGALARR
ncbi:arsenosugar biosynthesis radical SAM (seleno)protein ArsS [Methylocaldum sp.]|uniref:arsenosugar biosynthesis radical SAM (seleno)protein ArsS n=1 Tax=Methylocaldum sp. TaxID=1969727 RepID=UPI002D69065E|nr:arsenosugar biosynthesis radical SAM (seleno)protein ArsS [Methylocaldum sp.]HYE37365.1 arsenosugar biosynthesis radical SAM (seleno)protein ArsS [Methylocaldum sp.]